MTEEKPEPVQPQGTVPMWPLWVVSANVIGASVIYVGHRATWVTAWLFGAMVALGGVIWWHQVAAERLGYQYIDPAALGPLDGEPEEP